MLACARIGATHSVVFGGFSADALNGPHPGRRAPRSSSPPTAATGAASPSALKPTVDEAVAQCPSVEQRARGPPHRPGRRLDRRSRPVVARGRGDRRPGAHGAAVRRRAPAVHPLHVGHHREAQGHPAHHRRLPDPGDATRTTRCSTSSPTPTSTGAPPTSAGSPGTATSSTGRSSNGATQVMYEGTPDTPHRGRFWELIAEVRGHDPVHRADRDPHVHEVGRRHPGAVRPVARCGCSARVGEPINPEAWMWYREHIGGDRCPIVDTWWQTETGAIMISPLPGRHRRPSRARRCARCPASPPTSSTTPAQSVPNGGGGYLVLREPWPSHAAHDLGRRPAVHRDVLVALRRTCTSPATAPSGTRTATCGCSAGSTT